MKDLVRTLDMHNFTRLRPLRATQSDREVHAEVRLDGSEFVYPMFLINGSKRRVPISAMPGISRMTADEAEREVDRAMESGISRFLFFGIPDVKDSIGSKGWEPDEAVQRTVKSLSNNLGDDATLITDVCMCEYTDHGHCGLVKPDGTIDNDATLGLLAKVAMSHAEAGADVVAPSAMMDGQVFAIRSALDHSYHAATVDILGYSAKYASAFYGPFRDAAGSAPSFGDRRSHQMAPSQRAEAMREIRADIDEGADYVMVKPALAYLDVISQARSTFPEHSLYAYNVSGEYSMIHAAASNGWIDLQSAALEALLSIKRAGANYIITYFAVEAAKWLRGSD